MYSDHSQGYYCWFIPTILVCDRHFKKVFYDDDADGAFLIMKSILHKCSKNKVKTNNSANNSSIMAIIIMITK